MNGHEPTGAKSMDELYAIADACGVPRTFMETGFEMPERRDTDPRVDRLERRVDQLAEIVEDRLASLAEQALARAAESAEQAGRQAAR